MHQTDQGYLDSLVGWWPESVYVYTPAQVEHMNTTFSQPLKIKIKGAFTLLFHMRFPFSLSSPNGRAPPPTERIKKDLSICKKWFFFSPLQSVPFHSTTESV